jgi:Tryptophanase
VLSVAPFPTTRFHVEAAGGRIVDVSGGTPEFGSNVDLAVLARALADGQVGAVWLEPCNNALGGAPISLQNLEEVHRLASAAGVPVILDGARLWENAVLVQEREAPERSLADIVRALCAAADATATSLTKDLRTPVGAFIGARSARLASAVRDRTSLMVGDGLDGEGRALLAAALHAARGGTLDAPARVAQVRELASALSAAGVPVVEPVGGHAVYVDAAAALPHLGPDDHADYVLAGALYVEAGVRVAPNMADPVRAAAGQRWIRICVPIGTDSGEVHERLVSGLAAVVADPARWRALDPVPGGPDGALGAFARHFEVRP